MKTNKFYVALCALALGGTLASGQQPDPNAPNGGGGAVAPAAPAAPAAPNGRGGAVQQGVLPGAQPGGRANQGNAQGTQPFRGNQPGGVITAAPAPGATGLINLNMANTPLSAALNGFATQTGYAIQNLSSTPTLTGTVTLIAQNITREQAYILFANQLARNKYVASRTGDVISIYPVEQAFRFASKVIGGGTNTLASEDLGESEEISTYIVQLKYVSASGVYNNLTQFMDPTASAILQNADGNALIIVDSEKNMKHWLQIINGLDSLIASTSKQKIIQLQYADAAAMQTLITQLFSSSGRGNRGGGGAAGGGAARGGNAAGAARGGAAGGAARGGAGGGGR